MGVFTAGVACGAVDVQQVQDVVSSFHQFWSLPFQVLVTLYLLYRQVRWAFLGGLVLLIVFLVINVWISKRIGRLTGEMMTRKVPPCVCVCVLSVLVFISGFVAG
jgi:membrane protein YdbS with pleckstrin-like domain